jgi:hypothetical protein
MMSDMTRSFQFKSGTSSPRYMHVPNCAWTVTIGKLGWCRVRNKGVRGKFERLFRRDVFAEGRAA